VVLGGTESVEVEADQGSIVLLVKALVEDYTL
jgi:hypothetical protein